VALIVLPLGLPFVEVSVFSEGALVTADSIPAATAAITDAGKPSPERDAIDAARAASLAILFISLSEYPDAPEVLPEVSAPW
jgi:hypothetical protein